MNTMHYEKLSSIQSTRKTTLLIALVLFFCSLFMLVSGWKIAHPCIVFACLFHLICSNVIRRKYRNAFCQAIIEGSLSSRFSDKEFSLTEPADGFLTSCGLTPDFSFAPGARHRYVLHAMREGMRFTIAETSAIRMDGKSIVGSLAGTIVQICGALPEDERWIVERDEALQPVCRGKDHLKSGLIRPEGVSLPEHVRLYVRSCDGENIPRAAILAANHLEGSQPITVSACQGNLSLFVPNEFYAPVKPDISAKLEPGMFEGNHLMRLEQTVRLLQRIHKEK